MGYLNNVRFLRNVLFYGEEIRFWIFGDQNLIFFTRFFWFSIKFDPIPEIMYANAKHPFYSRNNFATCLLLGWWTYRPLSNPELKHCNCTPKFFLWLPFIEATFLILSKRFFSCFSFSNNFTTNFACFSHFRPILLYHIISFGVGVWFFVCFFLTILLFVATTLL